MQQGQQHVEPLLGRHLAQGLVNDAALHLLLAQRLRNFESTPSIITQFVVDEGAGITGIVNKLISLQLVEHTGAGFFIKAPELHLREHLARTVLSFRAKGRKTVKGLFFGCWLFHRLAVIKRCRP